MKYTNFLLKFVFLSLIFSQTFAALSLSAATFRDVAANHFALDAIRWVSNPANGSYMVGDASNNFNPGRVMDSFETAITLAMAAGFKYSPASITPAEQAMFDQAYERHSAVLANMASQHPNWRRAADREIAFLLELGILTQADLSNFMTAGAGGSETVAQLTKEAASTFVLRLSGNQSRVAALAMPPASPFSDDAIINPIYRRYAYVAHELGVVTDYDGYFSPHRPVSRAEFAMMCHALRIAAPGTLGAVEMQAHNEAANNVDGNGTSEVPAAPAATAPTTGAASPFASTFHGTIQDVQPDSIEIITADGTDNHGFGSNAIIVIDNVRQEIADLAAGMLVAVGLNAEGEIISLLARSEVPEIPAAPVTVAPGLPTTPAIPPVPVIPPYLNIHTINVVWFRGEGIVTAIGTQQGRPSLNIRTSRVRLLTGEIVTEETAFIVFPETEILRGDTSVPFTDIRVGEIINFYYSTYAANILHSIFLQEHSRSIQGNLIGRHFVETTPLLIIEDSEGNTQEIAIAADTTIVRNGEPNDWTALRIGDEIVAQIEFNRLESLQAQGRLSSSQGSLVEIHITQNLDTIMIRRSDGVSLRLALPPEIYDIYELRLGMELQLSLDSREIYSLTILDGSTVQLPAGPGFIGYVQSLRHGHTMVVSDTSNRRQTIRVDGNTINTATNEPLAFRNLRNQMRLYIVMSPNTNTAQSITILP